MNTSMYILFFLYIINVTYGCPPIDLPEHSSMNCTWLRSGVKQCRFECHKDADLIGSSVITCKKSAEQWNEPTPFCYPDPARCGKKNKSIKCAKMTKEYLKRFEAFRKDLTSEEKEIITDLNMIYRSRKLSRSHKNTFSCTPRMCKFKCPFFGPKKSKVNGCIRCKKKKVIKCSRSASIFGQ